MEKQEFNNTSRIKNYDWMDNYSTQLMKELSMRGSRVTYTPDLKQRYKDLMDKVDRNEDLTDADITMLYFWDRHKDEAQFKFLRLYLEQKEKKRSSKKHKTRKKEK